MPMTCAWPVDRSCYDALPADDDPTYEAKAAQQNSNENLAIFVLWSLSGRQFSQCPITIRPCPSDLGRLPLPWSRALIETPFGSSLWELGWTGTFGDWTDLGCGCQGSRCYASGPRVVHLPGPAAAVQSVSLAGVDLDSSGYQQEGDLLYRTPGNWPTQDLNRPLGEDHTWSVTYLRGVPVPQGVDRITGQLAQEFTTACNNGKCRLPRTVVSTSRSGVTHVFDPSRMLSLGFTGLSEVDSWLVTVNPNKLMQGPRVL